jgi:uncharacterized protein (TIGR02646 family)
MASVATTLKGMAGNRARCMFCGDSQGTDVDHFRPIAKYREQTFRWVNLLWICASCNRRKGDQFPVDALGRPLLVDPTAEDPWDYLFFDPHTGNITARYDATTGDPDPKGQQTTEETLLPLNVEAVTEGRQRASRHLRRAVRDLLSHAALDLEAATHELLDGLPDLDDYGLLQWFFHRDGSAEAPFSELRERYPKAWASVVAATRVAPS